jgi:uncharacterized membrane protein
MKVEYDFSKLGTKIKHILTHWIAFVIVSLIIGLIIFPVTTQSINSTQPQCLTAADLNRGDIVTSIVLSRFCEGMGSQSSVYWQQTQDGNSYGIPICLQIQ